MINVLFSKILTLPSEKKVRVVLAAKMPSPPWKGLNLIQISKVEERVKKVTYDNSRMTYLASLEPTDHGPSYGEAETWGGAIVEEPSVTDEQVMALYGAMERVHEGWSVQDVNSSLGDGNGKAARVGFFGSPGE